MLASCLQLLELTDCWHSDAKGCGIMMHAAAVFGNVTPAAAELANVIPASAVLALGCLQLLCWHCDACSCCVGIGMPAAAVLAL